MLQRLLHQQKVLSDVWLEDVQKHLFSIQQFAPGGVGSIPPPRPPAVL